MVNIMRQAGNEILNLEQKDLSVITDVLSDSFFDYPVMRYVIHSEKNYIIKLKTLLNFFVMARFFRHETILGIGSRSNIQGVALISNPKNTANPPELKILRDQVWSELGAASRSRYEKFGEVSAKFQVNVSHIHLNMIGIKNGAQGRGYGRKLIEQVHLLSLKDPDSGGITLTTEDPAKVSFYQYLGYHLLGESDVTQQLRSWSFFRPDRT